MQTLRLFVDVVRCHSFSQAATLHGISQSATSQRVHQLEKQLGVTLIDRSQRPLGLTAEGERFFIGCEDILERYDRLERSVRKDPQQHTGTVRVAAIYSAGIELLNDVRERYLQKHPQIDLELTYEHPDTIYQMVKDHEVDLGIVSCPEHWKNTSVIHLRDEMMALVCTPDHELATRSSVQPGDLAKRPLIFPETDLPIGRRIRQYFRDHKVAPQVVESFDNLDTMRNAVVATGHIAIMPKRAVMREVKAGTLTCVPLNPTLTRPVGIIYKKRAAKLEPFSPAVQVFVNDLIQRAAEEVDHDSEPKPTESKPLETATTSSI